MKTKSHISRRKCRQLAVLATIINDVCLGVQIRESFCFTPTYFICNNKDKLSKSPMIYA